MAIKNFERCTPSAFGYALPSASNMAVIDRASKSQDASFFDVETASYGELADLLMQHMQGYDSDCGAGLSKAADDVASAIIRRFPAATN